jgi:peptidoglycan hydrolase CwlO-like protein
MRERRDAFGFTESQYRMIQNFVNRRVEAAFKDGQRLINEVKQQEIETLEQEIDRLHIVLDRRNEELERQTRTARRYRKKYGRL